MDLNQLLYHHQMALMAVSQAQLDGQILPNFDLPRYYAKRINEYRERRGLSDALAAPEQAGSGPQADPATAETDAAYPAFIGDTLIAELLVNKALNMTSEERTARGLDGIVERLAGVQEDLWVIGRDIYHALDLDEDKLARLAAEWPLVPAGDDREPVHLMPFRSLSEDGIVHTCVEQFRVGAFGYTNIEDARAALLRQRSGSGSAGGQANDA